MIKKLLILLLLSLSSVSWGQQSGIKPMLGRQINWSHPLSRGLVGCWLMNEGGGIIANDMSGNGRSGVLSTAATWVAGKFGSAVYCPANAGYITTPTNTYDMGIRQHATFNIWFNCKNFTAVRYLLSDTDDVPALQGMSMYTTATTGVLAASVYPNNHRITSTVSPVIGKDHLLTFVMNGANEYLYLDGVQIGTAELNEDIGSSASPFRIGTRGDLDNVVTRCATSDISLVSVYNRAFSLNEIQQLKIDPFQMFRPPFDLYLIGGVVIPGISGGQLIMIQEL